MKPVLADTSYYIALLSENDAYHDAALAWSKNFLARIVVTEYVLVELGNGLSRSRDRNRYRPFVEQLLIDPGTIFVPASVERFRKGMHMFHARADKS
jgi:predicted nucleic acid-binding protein